MSGLSLGLEDLPAELLSHILCKLNDLPALLSAIQASRTLHDTFVAAKHTILSKVLIRHVGASLMRVALMAVESSAESHDVPGTAADHHHAPKLTLLELDQVLAINKLNAAVDAFAQRFVQYTAYNQPALDEGPPPLPTEKEMSRIKRTFHYLEIFRNRFSDSLDPRVLLEEKMSVFLSSLAPWEVEQLGCIHDFLFHQIKPAYDDIAFHDVRWGSIEVEPALNYASQEIQAIMCWGLISVHKLVSAETYEQRHQLLYRWSGPITKKYFLHHALQRYRGPPSQQSRPEGSRDGIDSGQQDAWGWAYGDNAPRARAYKLDRTKLRTWGYVFWDRRRLEAMAIFEEAFHPPPYVHQEHEVDEEFEASWRARADIASAGGTGYWSATDQSQVVYPALRQQARSRPSRGWPRGRPTYSNSRGALEAESARMGAAMEAKGLRKMG